MHCARSRITNTVQYTLQPPNESTYYGGHSLHYGLPKLWAFLAAPDTLPYNSFFPSNLDLHANNFLLVDIN